MCGMSLGSALGSIRHSHKIGKYEEVYTGMQTITMSLLTLFIEPLLYQAFLQIGTNFCYPFGKTRDHVPVHRMINDLKANIAFTSGLFDEREKAIAEAGPIYERRDR